MKSACKYSIMVHQMLLSCQKPFATIEASSSVVTVDISGQNEIILLAV